MTINEIKSAIIAAGDKLTEEFKVRLAGHPNLETSLKNVHDNVEILCKGVDTKYYIMANKTPFNVCNMILMDGYKGNKQYASAIIERL